jgi:hypothetical protein
LLVDNKSAILINHLKMIGRQMAVDRQWQNEKINLFFLLYATALYIWWKRDLS